MGQFEQRRATPSNGGVGPSRPCLPAGRWPSTRRALLLEELERGLEYPKLRDRIGRDDAQRVVQWLASMATPAADPEDPPTVRSSDPGDDYLIALAASERALLVSGDAHLLELQGRIPVVPPARFLSEHLEPRVD